MPRGETIYATIAQSASISGDIAVTGGDLLGLWCPIVTSAAMFLQGNFDTTSANFVRLQNAAGSGDWTFGVGPGSRAITLQDAAFPFPYLRVETSVVQANVRTVAMVVKFRTGAA